MSYNIFKALIGLIILFPFFQGALFMLFVSTGELTKYMNNPNYEFTSIYKIMENLMGPTVFMVLVVMLINLIYVYTTSKVPADKKKFWSGLIVVGNIWAAPFFWYWYIWKENTK